MPEVTPAPKADTFNFRVDPQLKSAFVEAAQAADRPAAQVLREFMQVYVSRRARQQFEAEAHRQSLLIAERSRDPSTDDYATLAELDALTEEYALAEPFEA